MSNRRLGAPMEAKRVPGGYQNGCPGTPGGTSGGHEGSGCRFGAYEPGTATTSERPLGGLGGSRGALGAPNGAQKGRVLVTFSHIFGEKCETCENVEISTAPRREAHF